MIKPMFGHRPKPRKFNYEYRYYDPKEDERRRRRIKIERKHAKYHQGKSVLLYALGLSLVIYLMYVL